jgi:hypothetical protein
MDSPRAQPDGGPPESQVGVRGAGTTITITPAAMLDLNPTGFVDDLTNMVGPLEIVVMFAEKRYL